MPKPIEHPEHHHESSAGLAEKPKPGDKLSHPEKGTVIVERVYTEDDAGDREPGTVSCKSEDGKHSFDLHASDLTKPEAKAPKPPKQ